MMPCAGRNLMERWDSGTYRAGCFEAWHLPFRLMEKRSSAAAAMSTRLKMPCDGQLMARSRDSLEARACEQVAFPRTAASWLHNDISEEERPSCGPTGIVQFQLAT